MAVEFPFDLRLPEAPYQFVWATEAAVDCKLSRTESYQERRYVHADASVTIIRQYFVDGSFRVMTDRGEIKVIDNAADPLAPNPVSLVQLP